MTEEMITLAGGCFWCTEAVFQRLKGVSKVESGYANSNVENPSYEQVSSGQTGAAECNQVTYDPQVISLEKILEVFFRLHDPTTLNRQGNDVGPQYRSAIFYQTDQQKEIAEKFMQPNFVTEIVPLKSFYKAEDYHQDYYNKNKSAPYCQLVIDPKIHKLYKDFKEDLKD